MRKYILFDNDGVLVETEMWYYEANRLVLSEHGFELPLEKYLEMMKTGGNTWDEMLASGYSQEQVKACQLKRNEYYHNFLRTKDIEINGVEKILQSLQARGFKMAIITTSTRPAFDIIHSSRNITKYMDFVLTVEDYPRAKPHPDPYLAGMAKFGATKEECIIVEDSERGLNSAVAADIECAIVHNEFTKSHNFSKATYKIRTLDELLTLI